VNIDVGHVRNFPDGQVSLVMVGKAEIGIINWRGRFHAIGGVCTHQGGPLCRGLLTARLSSPKPGEMEVEEAVPVIACPWHGWEFDIETGEPLWDTGPRIRIFPVEIVGDRVFIETRASRADHRDA
jgi:nitrite reductase/ring-hydroxylating ferredoxin subunit